MRANFIRPDKPKPDNMRADHVRTHVIGSNTQPDVMRS
jgi:hypothetical protein